MNKPFPSPRYLGDGVYAQVSNMPAVILSTGSHDLEQADNNIVLENEVCNALIKFIKDVGASQV